MSGVNEIRSHFLEFFRAQRPRGRALLVARAAQRSDADVHQRRHGAVQERLHRRREAALSAAPRPRRNACAPAASTTTSTMSATPRAITRSSRCSAISRSATISRPLAIELAWKLITRDFGLAKDRLLVTVYHDDDEAFDLWKRIAGLPESRIIRIATSDNFWAMGDTGPCGPCSEIFYDHGPEVRGRAAGLGRRGRRPLHRDLEPRLHAIRDAAGRRARHAAAALDRHRHGARAHRRGPAGQARQLRHRPDARADPRQRRGDRASIPTGRTRSRTASSPTICAPRSFLVADGVLPSNEGRGYVLRRIMRRAMRHAQMLGARDPLMWRLVPALVREMGQAYPELAARRGADRRDAAARGDALSRHARARPRDPRGRDARSGKPAPSSPARRRSSSTTPTASRSI